MRGVGRAEWGAELQDMYSNDALTGGHIISIGAGNEEAAHVGTQKLPRGNAVWWRREP